MAIAKFGPFEIPGINVLEERLIDIAQNRRVAGGGERRDVVGVKRAWDVRTTYIPASFVSNFHSYLRLSLWGYDEWWIEDFGDHSNTVIARIDASSWMNAKVLERPDLRTLAFTVIER